MNNKNGISWSRLVEKEKVIYDHMIKMDTSMRRIVKMKVPFWEEFYALIKELKDKYSDGFVDFLLMDIGLSRFYYSYRNSGLFDAIETKRLITYRFDSDMFNRLPLIDPIFPETNCIYNIRLFEKHYIRLEQIAQETKIPKEVCLLMFCVFIFNMAKEDPTLFKGKISTKFKMYYEDNGYAKFIDDNIYKASDDTIKWISECIPTMSRCINDTVFKIKGYECKDYDYIPNYDEWIKELKSRLNFELLAMDCAIDIVKQLNIQLFAEIKDYKENRQMFSRYGITNKSEIHQEITGQSEYNYFERIFTPGFLYENSRREW